MTRVSLSLLRGVCQLPAYVAYEKGFFKDEKLDAVLTVEPTAWMVPHKLMTGESQFAVIPWTRVAAAEEKDIPLVLICGSGFEEAAIVVRKGMNVSDVRKVSIPQRGGMKDLTAMGFIETLGWRNAELIRQPSGDGAIIALFGMGADAASMVEPYATMMESLGIGTVVKRTGDIWSGAPGCSLTTTVPFKQSNPVVVQHVVSAFARGASYVAANPDESAEIGSRYIGIHARFIRDALAVNLPNVNAIRNADSMKSVLTLMMKLGYIRKMPNDYLDLTFLDNAAQSLQG